MTPSRARKRHPPTPDRMRRALTGNPARSPYDRTYPVSRFHEYREGVSMPHLGIRVRPGTRRAWARCRELSRFTQSGAAADQVLARALHALESSLRRKCRLAGIDPAEVLAPLAANHPAPPRSAGWLYARPDVD